MKAIALFCLTALTAILLLVVTATVSAKPNVVIILADDLGYKDIGSYGGPVKTPNLDSLAKEGARFETFYSGSAVCSPSRATLLTGRHHIRTGVYSWIHDESQNSHLLKREFTIAEVLKEAGYSTAHIGKWHLGLPTETREKPTPDKHGFDYWFATGNNALPSHENPENFIRNGKAIGEIKGYSAQIVVDEAIEWLSSKRNKDTAFFLNLWFHEPHQKIAAPKHITDEYVTAEDSAQSRDSGALYSATIDNTDRAIGRLLKKLKESGELDNSLIIYASDNGSYRKERTGHLRGVKGHNWEGGLRVPSIWFWPGKIKAGQTIFEPAGVVDILPTIRNLVGQSNPESIILDGSDITSLIMDKGQGFERHQPFFWYLQKARPIVAIRDGDYSLVAEPDYEISTHNMFQEAWIPIIKKGGYKNYQLFNLKTDSSQSTDIAAKHPELMDRLKKSLNEINASIMADAHDWHLVEK
tara:strand:- start:573 stop:1979 length:1407 start_codon:yes stop_codon:yes gene_type:complete